PREAIAITVKTGAQLVERTRGHRQTVVVTCNFQRLYEGNRLLSFRPRGRRLDPQVLRPLDKRCPLACAGKVVREPEMIRGRSRILHQPDTIVTEGLHVRQPVERDEIIAALYEVPAADRWGAVGDAQQSRAGIEREF